VIDEEPTHVDLFSGIGGFALAAQWAGFRTVAFCEIDKYCQKVLAKNFLADTESKRKSSEPCCSREGILQPERDCRIHSNIFYFDGTQYRGCDLLTGGFPCQPFSVAGKRRGAADDRAIWPEMFRVIKEARPAWVLGENVPGIIPMEFDNVLSDLEGIGYACRPFVIPACAVDARHRRDRLWIIARNVAESEAKRFQGQRTSWEQESHAHGQSGLPVCEGADVADAEGRTERTGLREDEPAGKWRRRSGDGDSPGVTWLPEPDVGRVANGVPSRVDRLKGLGNAIVPQVAYELLREIYKLCVSQDFPRLP
jgi:DNA (cytosine-5)-methyltransferase 1